MAGEDRVFVIGVGMTKFERCETDVKELAQAAARDALKDADLERPPPEERSPPP